MLFRSINKYYAEAVKSYGGQWVPSVVMGQSSGKDVAGSGALQLIELLTAKTARDLGLDLSVTGSDRTAKRPRKE